MDGIGEYLAKWNKPIPKSQMPNAFSDKWMMIYNRGGGKEVREEWNNFRLHRGKWKGGGGSGMKNGGMNQT